MVPLIEWSDSLALGLPELDAQHAELAGLLNALAVRVADLGAATETATLDPELSRLLDRLLGHTRHHFEDEERLMLGVGYPRLAEHHSEHSLLLAELVGFVRDVKGGRTVLDEKALHAFKEWLVGHIVGMDSELKRFLSTTPA